MKMMRTLGAGGRRAAALALVGALALAASGASARADGAEPPAVPASEPPADADPQAARRMAIARRFAPELRYNAYVAGDPSASNRSEDFFPMAVDGFFEALGSGRYAVVVRRSEGERPAMVATLARSHFAPYARADHLGGFPERMAGSPPGAAPTYVHAYEVEEARRARADGGTDSEWFCEYWQFYPYDWACSRAFGALGCKGAHRGDWEHTSFRVAVHLGADGALVGGRILEGLYAAHGWSLRVGAAGIEVTGEDGAPAGTHPIVYVSQGKHGAYPEPGVLRDWAATAWLSDHDDFFRGDGVRVRTWLAPLVDIAPPARRADPQRFRPPAFVALLRAGELDGEAHSGGGAGAGSLTWLDYRGRWGPDLEGLPGVLWTSSATGPYAKASFGDRGRTAIPYETWKRRYAGSLELLRAGGGDAPPPLDPPPAPIWR